MTYWSNKPWREMTEDDKYTSWSEYVTDGGLPLSYPAYCKFMDYMDSGVRDGRLP